MAVPAGSISDSLIPQMTQVALKRLFFGSLSSQFANFVVWDRPIAIQQLKKYSIFSALSISNSSPHPHQHLPQIPPLAIYFMGLTRFSPGLFFRTYPYPE
jgi:hypothetical protein